MQVRQCTTLERYGDITFKQHVVNICDERQDQWAQKVAARVSGVIDLPAAAAQYHALCYDKFRKVRMSSPSIVSPEEEALRSVVMTMA